MQLLLRFKCCVKIQIRNEWMRLTSLFNFIPIYLRFKLIDKQELNVFDITDNLFGNCKLQINVIVNTCTNTCSVICVGIICCVYGNIKFVLSTWRHWQFLMTFLISLLTLQTWFAPLLNFKSFNRHGMIFRQFNSYCFFK